MHRAFFYRGLACNCLLFRSSFSFIGNTCARHLFQMAKTLCTHFLQKTLCSTWPWSIGFALCFRLGTFIAISFSWWSSFSTRPSCVESITTHKYSCSQSRLMNARFLRLKWTLRRPSSSKVVPGKPWPNADSQPIRRVSTTLRMEQPAKTSWPLVVLEVKMWSGTNALKGGTMTLQIFSWPWWLR